MKVRLAEVDRAWGTQAGEVLCFMIRSLDVEIEPRGTSYDRAVELIRVGGMDTSKIMAETGAP